MATSSQRCEGDSGEGGGGIRADVDITDCFTYTAVKRWTGCFVI